jgi:hypothetical protein
MPRGCWFDGSPARDLHAEHVIFSTKSIECHSKKKMDFIACYRLLLLELFAAEMLKVTTRIHRASLINFHENTRASIDKPVPG